METNDDKLRLLIGESKTRFEDTIITRGSHLFLMKDYQGSLECWLKIEKMRYVPKDVRFEELDGATRCYYQLKQFEAALAYSERSVSVAPNESSAWLLQGLIKTELNLPVSRRMESFLRAITCPSPVFEGYLNLAEAYLTLNAHSIVKYLLFKMDLHSKKTKFPTMYQSFQPRLDHLKQCLETLTTDSDSIKHVFESDTVLVELENRAFGTSFARILQIDHAASSSHTTDDDISEVRDPSRM